MEISSMVTYDNRKTILIYGLSDKEEDIIESVKLNEQNIFYAT